MSHESTPGADNRGQTANLSLAEKRALAERLLQKKASAASVALNFAESPAGKPRSTVTPPARPMSRTSALSASGGIDRLAKAMKRGLWESGAFSASARSRTIASKSKTSGPLADAGTVSANRVAAACATL